MTKKIKFKPGNMIYPLPAVMVTCGKDKSQYNIITISWTGTINTNPPMAYISVRPERHSYDIIKENKEFVINLTNEPLLHATDFNGVKSGRDINKFSETNLHYSPAETINTVIIDEAPVNIECKVKSITPLGSHHMFIAEVTNVLVDPKYMDEKTGNFRLDKAKLIAYSHGFYYVLGKSNKHFGFSVKKKTNNKNKTT